MSSILFQSSNIFSIWRMTSLILLLGNLACTPTKQLSVPSQVTFMLVRHAEKVSNDRDAALSEAGVQRAERLAELLADVPLTAVYSTDFQRTRNTAKPTADAHGLEIQLYTNSNPDSLARSLLDKHPNGTVLISGHSNSTPELANYLLGHEKYPHIHDGDYSHILVITCREDRKCFDLLLHY